MKDEGRCKMKVIAILLILVGVLGLACGMVAYGDIGIACMIGGAAALLSGIGFWIVSGKLKKLNEHKAERHGVYR